MVRPANALLELTPEALNGVRMHLPTHVFPRRVIDGAVRVALARFVISRELIRHQRRSRLDVLLNEWAYRLSGEIADHAGRNPSVALDGSEHDGLAISAAPPLASP